MRYQDALHICYAAKESFLSDLAHSTREGFASCPICSDIHPESSIVWKLPHDCAKSMNPDDAYVCCDRCAQEWREDHWEDIEEYELQQETK